MKSVQIDLNGIIYMSSPKNVQLIFGMRRINYLKEIDNRGAMEKYALSKTISIANSTRANNLIGY